MTAVEPAKSASATTSGGHSGWASTVTPGWFSRNWRTSSAVKSSWTSQWPCHAMISTLVSLATFWARYSSGIISTRGTRKDSTTFLALPEVQQISEAALTAAEVLT